VIIGALDMVDKEGPEGLTMAKVADRLGIKAASLYNHVDGLAALRREVALYSMRELGEAVRDSVLARSGDEAVLAYADTVRDYARRWPGRYQATSFRADPYDPELAAAQGRSSEAFVAVMSSYRLDDAGRLHAGRIFWASVHGFLSLEAAGHMGSVDVDITFRLLIGLFIDSIRHLSSAAALDP
jgi:AcrR family transcriptional regulator